MNWENEVVNGNMDGEVLTIEHIRKAMEKINEPPCCPYRRAMIDCGCLPEDGYTLILPKSWGLAESLLPLFVTTSRYIESPVCIKFG